LKKGNLKSSLTFKSNRPNCTSGNQLQNFAEFCYCVPTGL